MYFMKIVTIFYVTGVTITYFTLEPNARIADPSTRGQIKCPDNIDNQRTTFNGKLQKYRRVQNQPERTRKNCQIQATQLRRQQLPLSHPESLFSEALGPLTMGHLSGSSSTCFFPNFRQVSPESTSSNNARITLRHRP
ncbi:uncharacterized protein LOC143246439 [Tachypleus tridentatus]|uniref:uncharacterized protein LOC143246439 n=1 Tax=Tachypleus tridentatus TaxID=6853 RepID=UPI003FD4BC25